MEFAFLAHFEVEGISIQWNECKEKASDLVSSAIEAGFSEWEVSESPLGILMQDFSAGGWTFKAGARTLIGINGSTLIELI